MFFEGKILSWSLLPVNSHILNRFFTCRHFEFFLRKGESTNDHRSGEHGRGKIFQNIKLPNGQNARDLPDQISLAWQLQASLHFCSKFTLVDTLFFSPDVSEVGIFHKLHFSKVQKGPFLMSLPNLHPRFPRLSTAQFQQS